MKGLLPTCLAVCLTFQLLSTAEQASGPLDFQPQEVIALLGGENLLRVQRAGLLEAQLVTLNNDKSLRFRDLSWEGDTSTVQSSIQERWREEKYGEWPAQLTHVKATRVWAQYGKMESMAGLEGLQAFTQSYERLIKQWKQAVGPILLLSPIAFESAPSPLQPDLLALNKDLEIYVHVIQTLATKHHIGFVDLFHPSLEHLNEGHRLTKNGLHISPQKQAEFVRLLAEALDFDLSLPNEALEQAVRTKHRLWYEYWRPANWKCLFGDDGERIFGEAAGIYPTLREEWSRYPALIEQAEERIRELANGTPANEASQVTPILTGWSKPRPAQADPSKALSEFDLLDGFQVNLFASEQQGLVNPLAMRWDSTGKLYVACTIAYPQVEPGEIPNDYIVVLEDRDGDGATDFSQIFAEGLNIPTGIEIAPNGVYVGQGTQLLLLKDTDGDLIADEREIVLSGFGNGDTHQTSNSFVWSPGGQLYWCQGDGIESRVETPWGVSRLFQAGVFRLRPERLQLEGLLDDFMGPGNPWGIVFDDWGQPIVIDGAGGITDLGPALIPTPHRLRLPTIGRPGGYCGIDIVSGPGFPDSMQGDFVIGDYKPNAVSRFALEPSGASYKVLWKAPLLTSRDEYFRPVDVKQGPDGALYVCDWFNTVICHQDDSYRHTARDKGHGRVWRVFAKNRKVPRFTSLAQLSTADLVTALGSSDRWHREQSKRQLVRRDREEVLKNLRDWTRSIGRGSSDASFQYLQSLMMHETLEHIDEAILRRCVKAKDARIRAYAAQTIGRWHDRLSKPLDLLSPLARDPDPQVRMATILACGNIPAVESIQIAARVMRLPSDRWIDYAFKQTVRYLEPHWVPALSNGILQFSTQHPDLIQVIQATQTKKIVGTVRRLATQSDGELRNALAARQVLAATGSEADLLYLLDRDHYSNRSRYNSTAHRNVLQSIIKAERERPHGINIEALSALLGERSTTLKTTVIELVALWEMQELHSTIKALTKEDTQNLAVRVAAIQSLPRVQPDPDPSVLVAIIESQEAYRIQVAAITALVEIDPQQAAELTVSKWVSDDPFKLSTPLLEAYIKRAGASLALAAAIGSSDPAPDQAQGLLDQLILLGYSNPELTQVLRNIAGYSSEIPSYSEAFIDTLAKEITTAGDPNAGERIFRSSAANCSSCHQINGKGQKLGPDLSNSGSGIPIRRLIEEVIWPTRHVKEGYALTQITTKDGKIIQGYERKERDQEQQIILDEFGSENRIRIPLQQIESRQDIGTIMPPTAVSQLTRPQLRDLLRFLSQLGNE